MPLQPPKPGEPIRAPYLKQEHDRARANAPKGGGKVAVQQGPGGAALTIRGEPPYYWAKTPAAGADPSTYDSDGDNIIPSETTCAIYLRTRDSSTNKPRLVFDAAEPDRIVFNFHPDSIPGNTFVRIERPAGYWEVVGGSCTAFSS